MNDVFDIADESTIRKNQFAVDSRDIQLHYRYNNVMRDPTTENH